MEENLNKAVYTTASVTYGWAGAVTEVESPFSVFLHCMTDHLMDQRMDQWTNKRTDQPTELLIELRQRDQNDTNLSGLRLMTRR